MKTKFYVNIAHLAGFFAGGAMAIPIALIAFWNQPTHQWWHWILPAFNIGCLLLFPVSLYAKRWIQTQVNTIMERAGERGGEDNLVFTKGDLIELAHLAPNTAASILGISEQSAQEAA